MEKINFDYSLRNIATPRSTTYLLRLLENIESVIKRVRWKGHFCLEKYTSNFAYTSYGFKTRNYPLQCKELQDFETKLLDQTYKISDC